MSSRIDSPSSGQPLAPLSPLASDYRKLAQDIDKTLQKDTLDVWYPRCVDSRQGGFFCCFDLDWQPGAIQPKTLVFQSRMTWVASQIVLRRPALAPRFREIARHGADFLSNQLWDARDGCFFWQLTPQGEAPQDNNEVKHAYGISFGIYALASAGKALGEQAFIDRAAEAFLWLDKHGHDAVHGGYIEAFHRNGDPMLQVPPQLPKDTLDYVENAWGCRSMNTHLHLLESFTELYRVWPDPRLRLRLEELLNIIETRIYALPGIQYLYLSADWTPLPGHIPYAHDVETAYLLVEASEALGRPDEAGVREKARSLVDYSLQYGWDNRNGGFYHDGDSKTGLPTKRDKVWWAQAEGLNALLLMHEKYGSSAPVYWERFLQQWQFIQKGVIDPRTGGWFHTVSEDGSQLITNPTDADANGKGSRWKCGYHDGRALLNVIDRLNQLAGC